MKNSPKVDPTFIMTDACEEALALMTEWMEGFGNREAMQVIRVLACVKYS